MSPPTVPRKWKIGVGFLYAVIVTYSVVVMQQVVLGVVLPAFVIALVYFLWRVIRVFEMRYERPEADDDPLDLLKRRYANGEISEDEFEHRLEQLLNVEELEGSIGSGPLAEPRDDAPSYEVEDESANS